MKICALCILAVLRYAVLFLKSARGGGLSWNIVQHMIFATNCMASRGRTVCFRLSTNFDKLYVSFANTSKLFAVFEHRAVRQILCGCEFSSVKKRSSAKEILRMKLRIIKNRARMVHFDDQCKYSFFVNYCSSAWCVLWSCSA